MDKLKITPKQLEILLLLYCFRFLDRTHIQQLLNHKSPRRINSWLKDLTNKNIIGRHYSKKLKENTKPAVYYLSTKSKKILLNQKSTDENILNRVYRDKKRSKRLINHCLLVADIYLLLAKESKKQNSSLHFFTKTDLLNHHYLPENKPDAYIALENKSQTKRYFLEIIDQKTPRFMIRSLINKYIQYSCDEDWQKNTGHNFPSLLIVCPDQDIKDFLIKYIPQALEEEAIQINVFVTLKDTVKQEAQGPETWTAVLD